MRQLLAVAIFVVLVAHPSARAEVPSLIRYQGQAVDANGVPLEGPYTLKFRLYNAETAGTVVWEETQPNVPLSKGHFSILLGSIKRVNQEAWILTEAAHFMARSRAVKGSLPGARTTPIRRFFLQSGFPKSRT